MKYLSDFWDPIMILYKLLIDHLRLKHPTSTLLRSEFEKDYEGACKNPYLGRSSIKDLFNYLVSNEDVIPSSGSMDMTPAERECANGSIRAYTTEEGKQAVEEAGKRLAEEVRRIPLDEAEKELQDLERDLEVKHAAAERERVERERPGHELEDARKEFEESKRKVERLRVAFGGKATRA